MYPLQPLKVYAPESIQDDPRQVARMERMLAAVTPADGNVVWINDANIGDVARELVTLWAEAEKPADVPAGYLRPLLFTKLSVAEEPQPMDDVMARLGEGVPEGVINHILGNFRPIQEYHRYANDYQQNRVCWPTWDFGTMVGCPHGCRYCGFGKSGAYITVATNLEEYMDVVVPRTIAQFPWQKCFRMIGWSGDEITLEPEHGTFELFLKKLAEHDRYGYFHSAGANVDWIADLPNRERLIGIFSITTETIARDIEKGTGHAFDRFDAGRKLNEMGVSVRYKFKPTIPIRNWREEYARAIEYALNVSEPESLGFGVIMWMSLEAVGQRLDGLEMLDPEFVKAAQDAAEEMEGNVVAPFPHHVRKEIYQHLIREARKWSKDVKLFLSTESREMWDELKDELGQDPRAFLCGCSPVAPPGGKLTMTQGCPYSTYKEFEGHAEGCG